MKDLLAGADAAKADLVTLYFGDTVREPQANKLAEALRKDYPVGGEPVRFSGEE